MKPQVIIIAGAPTPAIQKKMWTIYRKYYHYTKEQFLSRAAQNTHFAYFYMGDQLVGFTGLRINQLAIKNKNLLLICFGQTVIEKAFRGQSFIPIVGAKLCLQYFRYLLSGSMYFWCDALTYKSYLVFAKTLEEFYPTYKKPTPPLEKQVLDFIGEKHYADSYCANFGSVNKVANYVNDLSAEVKRNDLIDPDVRFYAQANAQHRKGHGLLTLAPVSRKNFLRLLNRYLDKSLFTPVSNRIKNYISKRNTPAHENLPAKKLSYTNPATA